MNTREVDSEALLCALVLAPRVYSRNRFFDLHQMQQVKRVRRRAQKLRGILRELLGGEHQKAEIIGTRVEDDGSSLLRYEIPAIGLRRSVALSELESATLHFALHRAGSGPLGPNERRLVHEALARLGGNLAEEVRSQSPAP